VEPLLVVRCARQCCVAEAVAGAGAVANPGKIWVRGISELRVVLRAVLRSGSREQVTAGAIQNTLHEVVPLHAMVCASCRPENA